jgi:branched-subunit amino acid transport protein
MYQEIFLLIVIISMMAVTFALRLIPLHMRPERMPNFINSVIEYIPAAVISSITIPELFFPHNSTFVPLNASILAAVPVGIAAWYSKNLILSVLVGVVCQVLATHFIFN